MKIHAILRHETEKVKALWQGLNAHHLSKSTSFKDHFSNLTFEKRMKILSGRERLIAYVAEDDAEDVGYCIATVDGPNGEIDSLYVKTACRGQGIGRSLMQHALKWLDGYGCSTIRISIAEGNESILKFYEQFGFMKRFVVMQKLNP